jgi:hypothetical protein
MEPSRQQAYLDLIQQLLNCPSGEEPAILKDHPELLDSDFVAMCQQVAQGLEGQNQHENGPRPFKWCKTPGPNALIRG